MGFKTSALVNAAIPWHRLQHRTVTNVGYKEPASVVASLAEQVQLLRAAAQQSMKDVERLTQAENVCFPSHRDIVQLKCTAF